MREKSIRTAQNRERDKQVMAGNFSYNTEEVLDAIKFTNENYPLYTVGIVHKSFWTTPSNSEPYELQI